MDYVGSLFVVRELVAAFLFERREPCLTVDRDQFGSKVQMRSVAFDVFHQRAHINRHSAQHSTDRVEPHVDVLEDPNLILPWINGSIVILNETPTGQDDSPHQPGFRRSKPRRKRFSVCRSQANALHSHVAGGDKFLMPGERLA